VEIQEDKCFESEKFLYTHASNVNADWLLDDGGRRTEQTRLMGRAAS
jgi:hypothetical protein